MNTPTKILSSLALCAVLFLPCLSSAAAGAERPAPPLAVSAPEASPFAEGTVTLSPFASYRVHEFGKFNGKVGGGLALSYFVADNIALEAETLSEHFDDSHWADAFTEAGVNLKGYLPLGATGLAPYILVGYTRALQHDENRMNAGAGIAYHVSKSVQLFADGRWTHDFRTLGHALFRVGGGISF